MTETFIPAPTDAQFRDMLVTVHHCMSRVTSVKVADFTFERTMPVWAAVKACWTIGAHHWDEGDHASIRVAGRSEDRAFLQQVWICLPEEGGILDETSAIRFWTMVDQFGWDG